MGDEGLFHFHGLEHEQQVALDDRVARGDEQLHDGRLHRRLDGVSGGGVDGMQAAPTLGGWAHRADARAAGQQPGGQGHLDAASLHFDDDAVAFLRARGVFHAAGPRFDIVVELGFDPAGEDGEGFAVGRRERGIPHDLAVKRQHGRQAGHLELVEGSTRALEGLFTGRTGHHELGDERVERSADHIAGLHTGVDAHAGATGRFEHVHRAGRGQEAAAGILAVDAKFKGVSGCDGVAVGQLATLGEAELFAYQVDAGDLFGDSVLHLQAGVDLEERHRSVLADEKLAGAGAEVADLFQDGLGCAVHFRGLRFGQERRGRLLNQLLVPALQRAVAGRHDDDVAVHVGETLGLHVAGGIEVLLDEAFAAAEGGDGLPGGGVEHLGNLITGTSNLEAASTATEGGLDRYRQSVHVDEGEHLGRVDAGVEGAGRHRSIDLFGDMPGGDLVAELLDRFG